MAGSISLSLTQRFDKTSHEPLDGGKVYFYAAGTTTPQNAYQDIGLTVPWPNPLTLDSGGNVPQLFFADGYVKFRLANAADVTQIEADYVLVLGPSQSSGTSGTPGTVDATTLFTTGDIKVRYGTGALSGFVRSNGRSIGSLGSGASERANADCQALFEYLWANDSSLSVSSGRGATANADWLSDKNIALPDWRGRVIAGMDDMGNSSASRLTSSYFGSSATILGASGGSEYHFLTEAQLANHNHTGTSDSTSTAHTHGFDYTYVIAPIRNVSLSSGGTYGNGWVGGDSSVTTSATTGSASSTSHTHTFTSAYTGGNDPHNNVQPSMVATIYLKL